jgi:hypothetical protein
LKADASAASYNPFNRIVNTLFFFDNNVFRNTYLENDLVQGIEANRKALARYEEL